MVETKWLLYTNMLLNVSLLIFHLYQELDFFLCSLSALPLFQVQIYELEEHKIETWRGENVCV